MSAELPSPEQTTFVEIARLIQKSRTRAFQAVNEQLIEFLAYSMAADAPEAP